ncbi:MAG TPA: murein peptide amidase A [Thiomicrorhabdus sp.]|nr:murein peptide amidase A [Thiomicrorhabdus sp.]
MLKKITPFKSLLLLALLITGGHNALAENKAMDKQDSSSTPPSEIKAFCKELSKKLRTVKYQGCLDLELQTATSQSVEGRPLTYREYIPETIASVPKRPKGRILFLSGIHGDEYSSISITYLWMLAMLKHPESTEQHWLFLPLANPDGLLGKKPSTRMNANGVDLNRNFPSPDWEQLALPYWKHFYRKNKRRYPGPAPASEPETQWLVETIERFKPDAIISVHAPYGLIDYDGPEHAIPDNIGSLKHKELGTYPGSLGRYAGEYLNIPVLTLELHAAGTMPTEKEIFNIWQDIEKWAELKLKRKETDF